MHRTIAQTLAELVDTRLSSEALIEQARDAQARHADLNALAFVDWEAAQATARERDARLRSGRPRGSLHGIPISIKDLFNVRDMPTQAGTRAPLPELPASEAILVSRLRAAGAVIFAKTNMHEIALGATGENRWTGDVCNPFDPARQAGGSSSGAGVAVATGIGLGAIGSDTGGSIRIPAAFCGVTGFKPSYGAIPLDGGLSLSWTCDHAGPLAPTVDDCARLFEVMAQRRIDHGAVARRPRLAVPTTWLRGRLQPVVREHFEKLCGRLKTAGAQIDPVEIPALGQASACYTTIVRAEAAWVHRKALAGGGTGFSDLVRPALQAGVQIDALAYIDALKVRAHVCAELGAVLAGADALLLPSTAALPPRRGQLEIQTEGGTLAVRDAVLGQTLAFSMCGLPAVSIPVGLIGPGMDAQHARPPALARSGTAASGSSGRAAGRPPDPDASGSALPAGLQLVGRRNADAPLLALAKWVEAQVGERACPPA